MKTIGAAQFKQRCLALLESVGPEGIVITKRGKPIARLMPIPTAPADLIGSLRGRLVVRGDVLSTGVRWKTR